MNDYTCYQDFTQQKELGSASNGFVSCHSLKTGKNEKVPQIPNLKNFQTNIECAGP